MGICKCGYIIKFMNNITLSYHHVLFTKLWNKFMHIDVKELPEISLILLKFTAFGPLNKP